MMAEVKIVDENKHFKFTGIDTDHTSLISFRVDLQQPPTLRILDQLFEDLYLQTRLNPKHIFVAVEDEKVLTDDIDRCTNWRESLGIPEELRQKLRHASLSHIANQCTGKLIYLTPFRGLKSGQIIIGFFEG